MLSRLVFVFGFSVAGAVQLSPIAAAKTRDMQLKMLDDKEVASRGSHCMDGSSPGFFHKPGTVDGHWVFWLNGGGVCTNMTDCIDHLPIISFEHSMDSMPLHEYGEFDNYHHVMLLNCDLGLYLGDRSDPVTQDGHTLYFQGARIVKHVVDVLSANYSMTDVLFSGGSGGGQSTWAGADYFKSIMPSTVTRFAVAPINGWYAEGGVDAFKDLYTLMGMETTIPTRCKEAFSDQSRHNCIDPATAYKWIDVNTFMVQIFDYTFSWNTTEDLTGAWNNCLHRETASPGETCTNDDVDLLQEYLDNFTQTLQSYPKYLQHGQGGYLSTCTEHVFYDGDNFNQYANNGVTAGAAIEKFWQSLGTNPAPVWYLPCSLGTASNAQCESTCDAR